MYYRRKILLYLINAFAEQGLSSLKLQKMLFLFCRKQAVPSFDFIPYQYGCYSFQAARDLSVLESHYRLITKEGDRWSCNQMFIDKLEPPDKKTIDSLLKRFKESDENQIVNYIYDHHPYYSINSEWKMTAEQKQKQQWEKEMITAQNNICIFTVGYEGKSIDSYLDRLIENNIALLCDVRKNPLSMKYGFSKNQLRQYCDKLGIIYEHIPQLGIDSQKRKNLNSKQDYQNLFKGYTRELPSKKKELDQVLVLLKRHKRIAITCFEKSPQECHRYCISSYLQSENNVECQHL